MPDITMCTGRNGAIICPIFRNCHRFTASANPRWQSWMNAPIAHEDQVCESYWPNRVADSDGGSRDA